MIVPSPLLLGLVLVVCVPLTVTGALAPDLAFPAALAIAAFAMIAVLDGVLSRGSLGRVRAELPAIVRMTKDRAAVIDISLWMDTRWPAYLRIGLPLPRELESEHADLHVRLS